MAVDKIELGINGQAVALEPQYDPKKVEGRIYKLWEESGYFNPDNLPFARAGNPKSQITNPKQIQNPKSKIRNSKLEIRNFCIVVPPPNITGSLHMGHALNATIQDILIRKKRMEGYKTLWLPGTDHAGIATQNVVEKELKKQGISRHDLGRGKFIEKIWEWKEKYGNIILDQFKKLGSSMDWSRARFTMDPEYQKAVEEAFIHYYKKGWIYRGERTINWCTRCSTSLSDLELEHKEEQGKFYYIKYGPVTVGTVRPETKLGDTALAVNPKDQRYKEYAGKEITIQSVDNSVPQGEPPKLKNINIKVITDKAADPEFGTGIIKVTPAHDQTDFEIYERHPEIPVLKVIGENGRMTMEAGKRYAGLKVLEAREQIVKDLKELGLMERIEDYAHNISLCYRCGTVVEPLLSKQWFVKMDELAKIAVKAVKSGKVKFHPARWEKIYFDWLKNIRDWNISRQIWWGHKIPAGFCVGCGGIRIKPKIKSDWFFIRHGETDWNVEGRFQGQSSDIPLNENGRKQIRQAAFKLKPYNIDLIISSDLKRAQESAEILGKEFGAEIIFEKSLRERKYGILEGLTKKEIEEKGLNDFYQKMKERDFVLPEGGESQKEVSERVHSALTQHKNNHHHKNVIIVSHGATLRNLLRKLKNIPDHTDFYLEIHNATIVHFGITEDKCSKCQSDFLEPDTDVLDTWFSSALWPFATLGWPRAKSRGSDLEEFYPTQVLSTARDIINLWVTRMVFSGLEFMKKPPFSDVIIHATILTKDGKRMSKSLGTGIDPMTLIEKYGADATRFGLIWQSMGGQDIHWAEEHVIAGKKFCNKIWNSTRFVLLQISNSQFLISNKIANPKPQTENDKQILASLEKTKREVSALIEKYDFGQALHELHNFFWHEFCDVYIEKSKIQLTTHDLQPATNEILLYILSESLKLLHPFMPFITEEIWSKLPTEDKKLLIVESWPE